MPLAKCLWGSEAVTLLRWGAPAYFGPQFGEFFNFHPGVWTYPEWY
jgi:hypothetical protein